MTDRLPQSQSHRFEEVSFAEGPPEDSLLFDDIARVRLTLTADLGQAVLMVRDILELKQGSVIPLDKLAGEMTDLYVNGIPLAKAEVVVIADGIHVRVGEIAGAGEAKEEGEEDEF